MGFVICLFMTGSTRSPLLSNIQATAQGLATIRAFGRVALYSDANLRYIDDNTSAFLAYYTW